MYVQGGAIWHPKCGPGPQGEHLKNGDSSGHLNGMLSDDGGREFDRLSSSAASELQVGVLFSFNFFFFTLNNFFDIS